MSNSCKSCSSGCAKCSTSNICAKCELGYKVATNGSCIVISCPIGTFLDSGTYKCKNCHSSCETCSSDGTKCLTCQAGYSLGDTICLKCGDRQVKSGDTCVDCSDACMECTSSATCTRCSVGADLLNGKCVC